MTPARPSFVCANCARARRAQTLVVPVRTFATTQRRDAEPRTPPESLPRWRQAPSQMKMPVRVRPLPKNQPLWRVNDKPEVVDAAFDKFVGTIGGQSKGSEMVDEQTKWVAMTHKSFDQGRQGFNDRLAFLGKRIVEWQTALALLNAPSTRKRNPDEIFQHEALDGLENLTAESKDNILHKSRVASLAYTYNIDKAVRWQPRRADQLKRSGADTVMAQTIYSMVGALALRQGGEVAARTVRDRILRPLGLR